MNDLNVSVPASEGCPERVLTLPIGLAVAVGSLVWALGTTHLVQAESILLKGAIVHPVSGPTLNPGQVWMRDGKIAAIGSEVQAPQAPMR